MWLCTMISVGRSVACGKFVCALHQFEVVRIGDASDFPAVAQEAGRNIFGERDVCVALDGDAVAVIDPA